LLSCNQSNVSKGNTKKDTVTSSNAITSKIDSNSENIESNCDELIKQVEDKVTGAKYITNGTDLMISKDGKNGFSILAMITKNPKLLIITAVGAGSCIDDDEKANILFRDGSRLELENDGKFNCENHFTLYFGGRFGKLEQFNELSKKEIEILRVSTRNGFVEETLTPMQSKKFEKTCDCMRSYALTDRLKLMHKSKKDLEPVTVPGILSMICPKIVISSPVRPLLLLSWAATFHSGNAFLHDNSHYFQKIKSLSFFWFRFDLVFVKTKTFWSLTFFFPVPC
jgi:hypothetical protein